MTSTKCARWVSSAKSKISTSWRLNTSDMKNITTLQIKIFQRLTSSSIIREPPNSVNLPLMKAINSQITVLFSLKIPWSSPSKRVEGYSSLNKSNNNSLKKTFSIIQTLISSQKFKLTAFDRPIIIERAKPTGKISVKIADRAKRINF